MGKQETLDQTLTEASMHDPTTVFYRRGGKLYPISCIQDNSVGGGLQGCNNQLEDVSLCD